MHRNIHRQSAEDGIVIAFLQRDQHLDTNGPLHLTMDAIGQAPSGPADSNSLGEAR